MVSSSIISKRHAFRCGPGRIVQVKITGPLASDCLGIVRSRNRWKQWTKLWIEEQSSRVKKGKKANVERKLEECFQWKAHGQCSKGDSCSFSRDRLAQETCTVVRDEKDDRLLPHQNRRERKILKKKHQATEKKALQTKRTKFRAVTQILKTRHVNFGILPCVKATSLRPDVNLEEHVASDMLRLRRSPARSQFKVVRKDQLHH